MRKNLQSMKNKFMMLVMLLTLAFGAAGCSAADVEKALGLEKGEQKQEEVVQPEESEEVVNDEDEDDVEESVVELLPLEEQPEYVRDEYQSSARNRFDDPVYGGKVGMKNYLLARDTGVEYKDPEILEFVCWYCGDVVNEYKKVEYDHVIPLFYAHTHGAYAWDRDLKVDYCYDEFVGQNVCRSCNRKKSAKGPAEWLPSIHQQEYCQRWLDIAETYGLVLGEEDIQVVEEILAQQVE